MVQSQPRSSTVIVVNPQRGNDSAAGDAAAPYRTLTRALRRAIAGDTIRLLPGTCSGATGEVFPLRIAAEITVVGDEASQGRTTLIDGGGDYASPSFGRQNVGVVLEDGAQLRGATVTNRNERGTGVWVEAGAPLILNCTLTACGREGVVVTGNGLLAIADCQFQQNTTSGISCFRNAKGEIRRNTFQRTGVGIALGDSSAPLLIENRVVENTTGIVIAGAARPVLRNNRVQSNTGDGLVIRNTALPDLGRSQDPGGNVFQNNRRSDLRNETGTAVVSIGNLLTPSQVNVGLTGAGVEFGATEVNAQIQSPAPVVVPPPLPLPPSSPPPLAPTPPSAPPILPDLTNHWAEGFIRGLVQRQMVSGFPDGTFKPEMGMTRAQFAAILARAFDLPDQRPASRFVDLPNGFWATAAIAKAEAMGFLAGFPDGTFRPNLNLTRIQAIVALVNGLQLSGGNPAALSVYRDRAQIPSYATLPTATATQRRMVVNHPQVDLLEPMVDITRAEVAALIYQSLVALGQAPAIASPFIVVPDTRTVVAFADLTGHWAESFVRGMVNQELISGFSDGSFKPDLPMNRAQYAALLAKVFDPPTRRDAIAFRDVPADFWGAAAIARVYQGGLMSGYDDQTFRPTQSIRRIEVLLSLVNALALPAGDLAVLQRFSDRDSIPAFARSALAAATARRLVVSGSQPDQLRPMEESSRAEVSAMVYQSLVQLNRLPALNSPAIIAPPAAAAPPDTAPAAPLILLDPGHGGTDPGAVGINGLREKEVVLAIAQSTAAELQRLNLPVQLTRSDDRTLGLAERVAIAEQSRASHFVSIHANALSLDRPDVNGLETYHYPDSTASQALARVVHTNLLQTGLGRDRRVRAANFYVLRHSKIPAILVEVGFVTGQEDAPRLATAAHRVEVGKAIALGIVQAVRQTVG